MTTTREMIGEWFDEGAKNKQKYMLVVCDTFDHEDYPVYAVSISDYDAKYKKFNGNNMQRIMEVYDLSLEKTAQLNGKRVFNGPKHG